MAAAKKRRCRRLALFALVFLAAATRVAAAQNIGPLDRDRGRAMLRRIRDELVHSYYDSTLRGIDLDARVAAMDQRIQNATTIPEIFGTIEALLAELGDSHTFFIPPEQTLRADYGWDVLMIGDSCYIARVKAGSDAEKQGMRAGDRVISVEGIAPTRENAWQIWYVFHLLRPQRVVTLEMQPVGESTARTLHVAATVRRVRQQIDLTGSDGGSDINALLRDDEKIEAELRSITVELSDSVLVWKIPTFEVYTPLIQEGLKRARRARALVLDLRDNVGGLETAMLELINGLSTDSLSIASVRHRGNTTPLSVRGAGRNAFSRQLVVLVNSESASASEMVARTVQLAKRGTVMGDRTRGGVMVGRFHQYRMGAEYAVYYGVNVTESDVIMPDGSRLEGVGVMPDSLMLPTSADLADKRDPVLARALGMLGLRIDAKTAGRLYEKP